MPTTSYTDPAAGWSAWALQARTDTSGTPVDDADGEDARLAHQGFTEGTFGANAFQVVEDSPAAMTVVVGSGIAGADVAQIQGANSGQGFYRVRSEDATTDVTVPAADASDPRIDEVYLVVQDNAYDSSGNVVPRIGYRQGDAASSPSAPGPDAAWDAYLLIASISVGASVTSITNTDITDERIQARIAANLVDTAAIEDAAVTGAKGAGTFLDSFVLLGGNTSTNTLGTGDAQELADSVSIPAGWGSWSISVTVAGVYAISGSVSNVRLYIRPGSGLDGPFNDFDFTPDSNSMPFAVTLYRSGITSTGSQTIALRGSKTGAGTVTLPATSMSYVIRRES